MLVSGARRLAFRQSQRLPFARNRHQTSRSNIRRVSFEPQGPPLTASISEAFAAIQEEQMIAEQDVPIFQENQPVPPPPVAQNLEDPGRGFTLCERIFMIGGRNFFVPNETPDSIYCIDCYKRGGFHIALILVVVCMFLLTNAVLHPLSMVGRQLFISKAYQDMFLTDEDYFPLFATLFVYLIMILAGWTVHYTQKPAYDSGFFLYLNASRVLLVFGSAILVWHIWVHAAYYPDEVYLSQLEFIMRKTMKIVQRNHYGHHHESWSSLQNLNRSVERRVWDDTQTVFRCCGIKGYHDWLPSGISTEVAFKNFSQYVPRSCCTETAADSNCEAMFVHKDGCLQAQIKCLTAESLWVINPGLFAVFFAYLALYLLVGRLFSNTAAVTRIGRIFDLPPPAREPEPRPRYPI